MLLGGSRWLFMSWFLCPARFVGAPAGSLHASWVLRPPIPNACILLSTSLSTSYLNKRFSAAILLLSVVLSCALLPVFCYRPSSSLRPPLLSFAELPRRPLSSSAKPAALPAPLSFTFLTSAFYTKSFFLACPTSSSFALNFLLFPSLHVYLCCDDDAPSHSSVVLLNMIAIEDPRTVPLTPYPPARRPVQLLALLLRCLLVLPLTTVLMPLRTPALNIRAAAILL